MPATGTAARLAAMLVGAEAAELVAAATLRARRRRGSSAGSDDLDEPAVAAEVSRLFLAGRSRPDPLPAPGAELTERQLGLDTAFRLLTRRQQLLLARRVTEGLTIAELAGLVDTPSRAVEQDLATAEAQLPVSELSTLLLTHAAAAPGDVAIRRAVARQEALATRRRRRVAALVGCALLVALVTALAPAVVVPRLSGTARPLGTWDAYAQLDLPRGWYVAYRSLTPDAETVRVRHRLPDGSAQDCDLTLGSAGAPVGSAAPAPAVDGVDVDRVRVHWRPGAYARDVELATETLTWEYARDALAEVSCQGPTDRKLLYEMASSWLRVERTEPQLVPLSFAALPQTYRVQTLYVLEEVARSGGQQAAAFGVGSSTTPNAWSMTITLERDLPRPDTGPLTQGPSVAGRQVFVNSNRDGSVGCLAGAAGPLSTEGYVCVNAWWAGQADWPSGAQGPSGVVRATLSAITLAERLTDRSTWFEAHQALG